MHDFLDTFFTRYPRKSIRLLEIIPPLIAILLITLPFWGAFFFPVQLAYFIIFFDIYWLYKSLNLAIHAFSATKRIKEASSIDWAAKVATLDVARKVHHIIIIPTFRETVEKLKQSIDSIQDQTFPKKQLFVFIAMEEREEGARQKAKELEKVYQGVFGGLYFTFHPDLYSEVKGKSSNEAWAARHAHRLLVEGKGLPIDFLTVSSVDADAVLDRQYFSYLTYTFLTSTARHLEFWQSANVSHNNFWRVPAFTRVIAFFGSLWSTSLLVQGMRLVPNSTYSLSFKLLAQIGYWDTDVIPEDYRVFFKAFFKMKGRVGVAPIFLKTSMDIPQSKGYLRSLINKYDQERRWAWGISDDAVYLKWYLTVKDVPFVRKTYLIGNVLLDHILWPVNWFFITISTNLIVLLNPVFYKTSLGYNLPQLSGFILTLCLFALFVLMYIDFDLKSKKYSEVSKLRQFLFPLEFVLMPIAGFFLSALPALISHIQLIIGKRLEYKVTEKM